MNVMVYAVSQSANENAERLFTTDSSYFYWNSLKFNNIDIGDTVFVVNITGRYVLFSELDSIAIPTEVDLDNNVTRFRDNDENFEVKGTESGGIQWNEFVRLKIKEKLEIPENWQWQTLGASQITYLYGERINRQNAEKRLRNIEQIEGLTTNPEILGILEECRKEFEPIDPPLPEPNGSSGDNMQNILTAIQTKPFILLAGLSGTGKSRLARTLAYQTCPNDDNLRKDPKKPGNFELIPVRPNWHDSSELMGYVSRINGEKYITTPFLKFIAKAWLYPEIPFFLCLDEMNLAPVEQYFAEYLSIIETRQNQNSKIVTDYLISKADFENTGLYNQILKDLNLHEKIKFREGIGIPHNLVVIGTVNMDETTHSFSRKVLDRAMTFEMNEIDLNAGLNEDQIDWQYPIECIPNQKIIGQFTSGAQIFKKNQELSNKTIDFLKKINGALENTPFKIAYRVRDEFLIYCFHASSNQANEENDNSWFHQALDELTTMKILSRIEGDEGRTGNALRELEKILRPDFKKSGAKLEEMIMRLENSGYTSFWA